MAHYPADTYQEATELAIEASNQLHGVINGDANAEVIVEDGSKIPSVRKAMVDSLYFLPPIAWEQGEYENTYNQLREFVDGDVRTWWFAKGATVSTPVLMSTNPATDINWTLWGMDQAKLNALETDKANTSDVNAALALKADTSYVNAALAELDTTALLNRTASLYVTASVSDGVMTWTLPKQTLIFRNPTLTNGATVEVTPTADLKLTFPVGSSCGTRSGILGNLVPVVLYNNGSPVLGVQNLAGDVNLSEAGLISATAISASATSASVTYASTAVTSSPYITAGLVQSTQATAGTWATAPSIIPKTSSLISQLSGVGYSLPIAVSKDIGTTYYNTSSKPKRLKFYALVTSDQLTAGTLTVDGVVVDITGVGGSFAAVTGYMQLSYIIAPGSSYVINTDQVLSSFMWRE